MDIKLVRAFFFNREILGILIAACFVAGALDIYLEGVQQAFVEFSALRIAKTSQEFISQFAPQGLTKERADSLNRDFSGTETKIFLELINPEKFNSDFQKQAYAALLQNPINPFYQFDDVLMRYAIKDASSYFEMDLPLTYLNEFSSKQSYKTLWVLIILTAIASLSMAIFFGFFRRSSEVLLETQSKALDYQKKLTYAYGRFFPHEFLDLLQKQTVLEINLGDLAEKKMAILFIDIRNFTNLIEKLSSSDCFKVINDYLSKAGPIIRLHHGFIDKYIGDAIMALFDNPDAALSATLAIMDYVYHSSQQTPDLAKAVREIGAGLHFGSIMIGTVGETERMDGTVISDIVNTASRVESLNKAYGTHVLITESFLDKLQNKEKLRIRFVDHVYAMGKVEGIQIFEVYDTDSPEKIKKKELMKTDWETAIELYRKKQFEQALVFLKKCQQIYPEDGPTNLFILRTKKLIAEPPEANWVPIAKLNSKDEVL